MVCRFDPPAAAVCSVLVAATTFVVQSIESVPKATQGGFTGGIVLVPRQVEPGLFTLGHKCRPDVGNVKFTAECSELLNSQG
jgi:hypothetical protein